MYSGTSGVDVSPRVKLDKGIIVMEWSVNGAIQAKQEFTREIFTSRSGVLTLLDLDQHSTVRIDKHLLNQSIAYYFKRY